jgi:hypothetical protein
MHLIIHKALRRKLKIEQHESHENRGWTELLWNDKYFLEALFYAFIFTPRWGTLRKMIKYKEYYHYVYQI